VLYPLFFATVAFFVFRARRRRGAALRVARARGDGHVVGDEHDARLGDAARALAGHARAARRVADALRAVLLPSTIALATIGIYSMVATLLWGGSRSAST
jgi:hypothetical protein